MNNGSESVQTVGSDVSAFDAPIVIVSRSVESRHPGLVLGLFGLH